MINANANLVQINLAQVAQNAHQALVQNVLTQVITSQTEDVHLAHLEVIAMAFQNMQLALVMAIIAIHLAFTNAVLSFQAHVQLALQVDAQNVTAIII